MLVGPFGVGAGNHNLGKLLAHGEYVIRHPDVETLRGPGQDEVRPGQGVGEDGRLVHVVIQHLNSNHGNRLSGLVQLPWQQIYTTICIP